MAKKKKQQPKKDKKKLVQHLFRAEKEAEKKAQGWKEARPVTVEHKKMTAAGDLVLMEKYV